MVGAFVAFKKRAYLLIEVDPGSEVDVIHKLEKLDRLTNIDFVHGEFDIVCVLEGSYSEIDDAIITVRKISHIRKTTTLTAFETHLE
jgi:hypothetical protein